MEKSLPPTNMYSRDGIFQAPQVSIRENPYSTVFHLGSMVTSLLRHWHGFLWLLQSFFSILYQFQTMLEFQKFVESGILKRRLFMGTAWLRNWSHFPLVNLSSDLRSCYWVYSTKKRQLSCRSWILRSCLCWRHAEGSMCILHGYGENKGGLVHIIATANHLPQ